MYAVVPEYVIATIWRSTKKAAPNELGGFLMGYDDAQGNIVITHGIASSKAGTSIEALLDPAQMQEALQPIVEKHGGRIIGKGFFHSHPDLPLSYSTTDVRTHLQFRQWSDTDIVSIVMDPCLDNNNFVALTVDDDGIQYRLPVHRVKEYPHLFVIDFNVLKRGYTGFSPSLSLSLQDASDDEVVLAQIDKYVGCELFETEQGDAT